MSPLKTPMSSINHFFIPPESIQGSTITFPPETARQISRVLRLQPGDQVIVLDGLGKAYDAQLTAVDRGHASAELTGEHPLPDELRSPLHLLLALTPRDKLEFILQKATELGVSSVRLMQTKRCLVRRDESAEKTERRRQIVREAAEQSHRLILPQVFEPQPFEQALEAARRQGVVILCHEAATQPLTTALREIDSGSGVSLAIGPEGGFSDAEVSFALGLGLPVVSLGKRVLRVETAALAALAITSHFIETEF